MRIIDPSVELMRDFDGKEILKFLEKCGRTAYKSESNITDDSAEKFIRNIIKRGHESVLEHFSCTFRIICDRGVSHEIVRHRLASYTQESTRFCNYASDKFNNELTFIKPCFWAVNDPQYIRWKNSLIILENKYLTSNARPEEIRSILPNSLKTEIVMTANLREWRHFLKLRTAKDAHPQMRQVALIILAILRSKLPVVFEDITFNVQTDF